ncbi:MAG: hemolysin III family protein [Actinobacteria bacterium]|nr:hemolysin III family protein [Actinomycetota bacterium]MCI0678650.1 hemolysin III family protein [Actinomycetota bacterium]
MERMTLGRMVNPVRGFLHGAAALAASAGLLLLVRRAWGDGAAVTTALIYGGALIVMYTVSTLYHSIPWGPLWKRRLQRIDHAMIYLVVAGTFTPVAVAALEGWSLAVALTLVWSVGLTGIVLKTTLRDVATWLSVTLQLVMGWVVILWIPQILDSLGTSAVAFIALGGICYTIGVALFLMRRPRLHHRIFSYHEVFHLLVVTASILHYVVVFRYAVPVIAST